MKALLIASLLALYVPQGGTDPRNDGVDWTQLDVDEGIERAREEGRQVFVVFHATWCGPCKNLDRHVLSTDEGGELTASTIAVRIDVDDEATKRFGKRYGIKVLPTTLVLEASGKEVGRIRGYPGKSLYLRRARKLIADNGGGGGGPTFQLGRRTDRPTGYSTPRRSWSRSMERNRAPKLPSPKE